MFANWRHFTASTPPTKRSRGPLPTSGGEERFRVLEDEGRVRRSFLPLSRAEFSHDAVNISPKTSFLRFGAR